MGSKAVNALDPIGYGSLLLIDGRRAGTTQLADVAVLAELLRTLGEELEPGGGGRTLQVEDDAGASVAQMLDEAQLLLHAFPAHGAFAFRAFSRHALSDGALLERVLRQLRAGHFETALKRRAVPMPADDAEATVWLTGARGYARARLEDGPLG